MLQRLYTTLLGLSILALGACQTAPQSDQTISHETQSNLPGLQQLFDSYFEDQLKLNPVNATYIGDPRYNHLWVNNLTELHRDKQRHIAEHYLQLLEQYPTAGINHQDALSLSILKLDLQNTLESLDYPNHLIPINQFYSAANTFAVLGSGKSAQPFKTVQDYENFIQRANGFAAWVDQAISNMTEGAKQGIVQPEALMSKVIPQLKAHIVSEPSESIFWGPINNFPATFSEADQQRLSAAYSSMIEQVIVPTYRKLHDYIKADYLNEARQSSGMTGLPKGSDWYAMRVRHITSTDLTPAEIHTIGLNEVKRIHKEMRAVMQQVGFAGELKDFFAFTRDDPQFVYPSKAAMLKAYNQLRTQVELGAPLLFNIRPKADYEIRAVEPFREKSASNASYQSPPQDGSRPGIFYVNTYDLSARPTWNTEALFLHEAIPGHHFQLALQQELSDLPKFRKFGGTTAFIEGWGLYSESLGKELGVYTDPYQYYGALAAELWRAIRLVVDTGLHYKGWSREQVLEYMYANAPVAEARAVSETERFMAIPGQALAYKIGQIKIRELRSHAEASLGDQFDIRAFHTQILNDGALPLNILETKIQDWIDSH